MPVVRLFAQAREAAGVASLTAPGDTVGEVLAGLSDTFGAGFADVLSVSRVWVNGEPAGADHGLGALDEVAVLPPVSGG